MEEEGEKKKKSVARKEVSDFNKPKESSLASNERIPEFGRMSEELRNWNIQVTLKVYMTVCV